MTDYEIGQRITAVYWTSVYKAGCHGWRSERVEAELEVISKGKAKVVNATLEDAMSKRQRFNTGGIECRELGKVKIISKLTDVKIKTE